MSPRAAAALVALAAALPAIAARADTCGPVDGIDLALPVDGSVGVDRAAWIVVRHALSEAPTDGAPDLVVRDESGDEVGGDVSWDGREVVFVPAELLAPGAEYSVVAARPGRDPWSFSFATAEGDGAPFAPVLGPSLEASFEYLGGGPEGDDACGPIGFERYRIHLDLPAAAGSSGRANLEYIAFQTRGHGITDPLEVARAVDETGGDHVRVDLYRPANGVRGRACFRVLAMDVTGPPSGTTDEACVHLEEGPFFVSMCGAVGPAGEPPVPLAVAAAALVLVVARRRSR